MSNTQHPKHTQKTPNLGALIEIAADTESLRSDALAGAYQTYAEHISDINDKARAAIAAATGKDFAS
tara:strand:+ start:909 stop:1109 length:201 start_codon:yes stop_codon:yes gene_type:complete